LAPKCSLVIPAAKGTKQYKLPLNFAVLTTDSIPCSMGVKTGSMLLPGPGTAVGEHEEAEGEDSLVSTAAPEPGAGAVHVPGTAESLNPVSAAAWRETTALRHGLSTRMLHGQCGTVFVPLSEHVVI